MAVLDARRRPSWQAQQRSASIPASRHSSGARPVGTILQRVHHPTSDQIRWASTESSIERTANLGAGRRLVRLDRFGRKADYELSAALHGAGALVLDLRHNQGGVLRRMLRVAGRFTGPVPDAVHLVDADRVRLLAIPQPSGAVWRGPITVLVGPNTISSGEVLAALLRRHAGATVLGERTWGKDYVLRVEAVNADWRALVPDGQIEVPGRQHRRRHRLVGLARGGARGRPRRRPVRAAQSDLQPRRIAALHRQSRRQPRQRDRCRQSARSSTRSRSPSRPPLAGKEAPGAEFQGIINVTATPDGRLGFAAHGEANELAVIDLRTRALKKTRGARRAALAGLLDRRRPLHAGAQQWRPHAVGDLDRDPRGGRDPARCRRRHRRQHRLVRNHGIRAQPGRPEGGGLRPRSHGQGRARSPCRARRRPA